MPKPPKSSAWPKPPSRGACMRSAESFPPNSAPESFFADAQRNSPERASQETGRQSCPLSSGGLKMGSQRKVMGLALGAILLASCAGSSVDSNVAAPPAEVTAEQSAADSIVVTGQLIARPNLESSSPVSVIGMRAPPAPPPPPPGIAY